MKEVLVSSRRTISNLLVPFPTIVTTQNKDGVPNALAMSYITAIHWDPPSVILSLGKNLKSCANLCEQPKFTINVMKNDVLSRELINQVGTTSGEKINKLEHLDLFGEVVSPNNDSWPPAIQGAVLVLNGKISQQMEYKGQILFIGEIIETKILESLHTIDNLDSNLLWRALDEIVLNNADIYSPS
jgi:flavin reductase (DIM6/NTAB) family NADH-FMN oxidoreductase RutF